MGFYDRTCQLRVQCASHTVCAQGPPARLLGPTPRIGTQLPGEDAAAGLGGHTEVPQAPPTAPLEASGSFCRNSSD